MTPEKALSACATRDIHAWTVVYQICGAFIDIYLYCRGPHPSVHTVGVT